jgi:hypothetical protein
MLTTCTDQEISWESKSLSNNREILRLRGLTVVFVIDRTQFGMLPCWQVDRTVLRTQRVDNSQAKAHRLHGGINRPNTIKWILTHCGHKYTRCFLRQQNLFLGAVAKLRKATISFVMSVCTSVRLSAWNNSVPTERIFTKCFMKFDTAVFFKNLSRKFNFP